MSYISGQVIYSENDELVTKESIIELDNRIKSQKGVEVIFSKIKKFSNHFFKNKEKELKNEIEKYLKEKHHLFNYLLILLLWMVFTISCIWKSYW